LKKSPTMERTVVILKPDAVQRGMIGRIVSRFEDKGFKIVAMKMMRLTRERAERFYEPHKGKHFYEPLVRFMTSGAIVALVLEGKNAVQVVRRMLGETFGAESPSGTIRGDFGLSNRFNLVHASDSLETADREMRILFDDADIVEYDLDSWNWIYDLTGDEPV